MAGRRADRAAILPQIAEVFREHGYEGASLALIEAATGLGKGSLYHFFPDGKAQMAEEVLTEIAGWFEALVFGPLRGEANLETALDGMFEAVLQYFQSGRRVCLVGVFALGDARDRFAVAVQAYFTQWIEALAGALRRAGRSADEAASLAEEIVLGLQGAIVLARALHDPRIFARTLARLRARALEG